MIDTKHSIQSELLMSVCSLKQLINEPYNNERECKAYMYMYCTCVRLFVISFAMLLYFFFKLELEY